MTIIEDSPQHIDIVRREEQPDEEREALERRANVVRWKLMRTLDALDKKRHEVVDLGLQVRRHIKALVVVGGAALLALGGAISMFIVRQPSRARRLRRRRFRALGRVWRHPDQLTRAQDPVLSQVFKRVATAVITSLVTRMFRRTLGLKDRSRRSSAPRFRRLLRG